LVDHTVKLKSENEILEMRLEDKSHRIEVLEDRIGRGISKGLAEGIQKLENRVKELQKDLAVSMAEKETEKAEKERLNIENKKLKVSITSISQQKGEDISLVLKVGELTEQVVSMQQMADTYQYLEEELAILRDADKANKNVQLEVELEFDEFKRMYEEQIAKCIFIEDENKQLKSALDNFKHRVAVKDIEIEQLTNENHTVNSKKAKLFKDKVAEFEEQKVSILEESEFNSREVERMTKQLKKAEERIHVLEQYLLKERHEKNKIKSDLESATSRDQERYDMNYAEVDKDYTEYYKLALDKFDHKSKDQISKRKISSSIVSQSADRHSQPDRPDMPTSSFGRDRSKSKGKVDNHRIVKPSDRDMPDLSQVKVVSTGSRQQRLEKLTATNNVVEAWLSSTK
jgi:hypothetical protein